MTCFSRVRSCGKAGERESEGYLSVTTVFVGVLEEGHGFLARGTGIRFDDDTLSCSLCVCDGE